MLWPGWLLAVAIIVTGVGFTEETPSNLKFLRQLLDAIAKRAIVTLNEAAVDSVFVETPAGLTISEQRMLYGAVVVALQRDGKFNEVLAGEADSSQGIIVRFNLSHLSLQYKEISNAVGIKGKHVQRRGSALAEFDIRDLRTGKIYFQGPLEDTLLDTVRHEDIVNLELETVPLTLGTWQKTAARSNWIEPAVLTILTGAVVYALYKLRSQ